MPKIEEKIIKMRIDEIKPYKQNTKKHPEKQIENIVKSIKEYGFNVPLILDNKKEIICGHGRYLAAQKIGMEELPCILKDDLTPAQVKAFRIADNKVTESEWDYDLLKLEFEDLKLEDFDLDLTGFDNIELDKLFQNGDVIEDEAPQEPEIPRTVKGDIYQLGNHRVMCGDSTLIDDVEKLMDGKKADIYLSDPPYNVAYEGKTKDALTIQNDKMDNNSFRVFLKDAFSNIDANLKPGGVFYIWHADSEGYNFRGACFDIGWQVRQCLIWNKNTMVMGRQDYHWKHEPCLYGWKDGSSHLWASDRKQTTILSFERPTRSTEHPTMKPINLFAYQIQNNTKEEDLVVDNFLGSGSTLIACEQTNRICYGMELDEKYCDVIVQRWVNLTGGKVILNGAEIEW